jgi:hypothetical protein
LHYRRPKKQKKARNRGLFLYAAVNTCGAILQQLRLRNQRLNAHRFLVERAFLGEYNVTSYRGEQGMVFAHAYIYAGVNRRAALAYDDAAC